MEKFAVDLEKVLDEFEYNEEREENVSAPSIRNTPLPTLGIGALRQVTAVRPPAASYRRPSFEPINLADADFAASPPKPSTLNLSLSGEQVRGRQNEDETFGYVSNKAQFNNRNYANADNNLVSVLHNESNIKNRFITESEEETSKVRPNPHSSNDEKPDLLEYNNKNLDYDTDNLEIHNQLPDITTSVRTVGHDPNSNEEENVANSLDLISSTSGHLTTENGNQTETFDQKNNSYEPNMRENLGSFSEELNESNSQLKSVDHLNETCKSHSREENKVGITLNDNDTQDMSFAYANTNLGNLQIVNNDYGEAQVNEIINPHTEVKYEVQPSNGKLCVSNEENISKTELETGISRFSSQMVSEIVQPIGFTNDSDVSESELEEYLKDLEEMDESVDFKGENVLEECLKELKIETSENNKDNDKSLTESVFAIGKNEHSLLNRTSINTKNTIETNLRPKEEEAQISVKVGHNDISPETSVFREKTLNLETKSCMKNESPVVQADELDTSSSSTPQISENESSNEESNKIEDQTQSIVKSNNGMVKTEDSCEEKDTSVSVEKSYIKLEKISTNPFSNSNPFESQKANDEYKREIESTNPFDDEDSGYMSEKMESKRKSTNPFEDDDNNDEDISIENSSSETAEPPRPEILAVNVHPDISKSQSESSENYNSNYESLNSVVSATTASDLETQNLADRNESTLEIVSNPKSGDENAVNAAIEDNRINNSLPGSSNANTETFSKTLESTAKMIPIKAAVESPEGDNVDEAGVPADNVDEAGVPADEDRPLRPSSLELPKKITVEATVPQSPPPTVPQSPPPQSPSQSPIAGQLAREFGPEDRRLGKIPPFWVPDTDATSCMQCQQKFTVIKRRHHCRACGQVLCYKCCGLKARLEYMSFTEARVCQPCFTILEALNASEASSPLGRQPNPNNPMEYCSTIPPLQQAAGSLHQPPPSVMVPVGVLKREGRTRSEVTKQVMFSDGIRPGGDLTELDGSCEPRMPFRRPGRLTKRVGTPPGGVMSPSMRRVLDPATHSFIPSDGEALPPVVSRVQGEITFSDLETPIALNQPTIKFALNRNLFVVVKRVMLDCCVNRECWCFSTEGLACVGQDEIVFLLECLPQETQPPKDIFLLINYLYQEAAKGSTVSEMSFTPATSNNLLGSKDHGGFLYIRTSYQCTAQLVLPSPPYLVALLIHRWETPWAKLFPLRLVLRLGAEFRYYPCPLVSVRNRPPLYTDIGHTIINILADFRKYSYTLPSVRGLVIHMEDRQTTINIPRNRYDQVVRALNNSNDSVLAFGANLSLAADSHLVCMQSTEDENTSYTTQAINIHNKPRKVTGASFVVFNGALKVPGLAGKSSIVEDGLMVQVPSETMTALRTALRDMRDYTIGCGPNAEETVTLQWTTDDTNFNIGVKSCIDGRPLDGVPSIRVHNGTDYSGGTRIIRWTEVFILQCEDSEHSSEPLDISRLSESIARATCLALVPLLDLLSAASFSTLAVRTTIHPDNVGYEAGSNGEKLPPLYMKSLDDELIAVVHQAALASQDNPCVLELVFRIMEQG